MASDKDSLSKTFSILSDIIEEIKVSSLEEIDIKIKPKKTTQKKKNKLKNLDDQFWEEIRLEISNLLRKNYNAIRIINSPRYQNWKRRAKEKGLNVKITDSEKKPVIYIRPALRTGELRDRITDIDFKGNTTKKFPNFKISYEVTVSDLYNDYGNRFRNAILSKTGLDIFALTEEQLQYILDKILRKLAEE